MKKPELIVSLLQTSDCTLDANLYEYTYTPTYSSGLLGMSTALNGSQHLKFIKFML